SRVLMDLFKARQHAQREFAEVLAASGLSQEDAEQAMRDRGRDNVLCYPPHRVAGTAANTLLQACPSAGTSIHRRGAHRQVRATPAAMAACGPKVSFRNGAIALVESRDGRR